MTFADAVARQFQGLTSARSETAEFVRMEGRLAVVNIGSSTVSIPCVGFTPPLAGMAVRVDWVNGSPSVTGPVRPLNPLGTITAAGTPLSTVVVDGVAYTLPRVSSYTPEVDDQVMINWDMGGVIVGKVATYVAPEKPRENPPVQPPKRFEIVVRAEGSARIQSSGPWGNDDPWASNTNRGVWVYGNRVRDAIAGASINFVDIYLPLVQQVGNVTIGVHTYSHVPGGMPDIQFGMNLPIGSRHGWVRMPNWGTFLAPGGRGVGVFAPGGGYTIWRGVSSDPMSGALRFNGTR